MSSTTTAASAAKAAGYRQIGPFLCLDAVTTGIAQPKKVALLCGWMDGAFYNVSKYARFYHERGHIVVVALSKTRDILTSQASNVKRLGEGVPFLEELGVLEGGKSELVIHTFSNGGNITLHNLTQSLPPNRGLKSRAVILDSNPGRSHFETTMTVLTLPFSKYPYLLRKTISFVLRLFLGPMFILGKWWPTMRPVEVAAITATMGFIKAHPKGLSGIVKLHDQVNQRLQKSEGEISAGADGARLSDSSITEKVVDEVSSLSSTLSVVSTLTGGQAGVGLNLVHGKLPGPRLFLYSKADALVSWRDVKAWSVIARVVARLYEKQQSGSPSKSKVFFEEVCWEDSEHVKHGVSKKEEYWAAVEAFLKKC
ncbi:hypothetical protein HDU76_003637 [Blyttiomyces sp. JEL0837]|nr:hypothetical protein HDU76_003637 [Blyttiomyces sp. JEL0837]